MLSPQCTLFGMYFFYDAFALLAGIQWSRGEKRETKGRYEAELNLWLCSFNPRGLITLLSSVTATDTWLPLYPDWH